ELGGGNHLVELVGEHLVGRLVGEAMVALALRRGRGGILARLGLGVLVAVGRVGLHALDVASLLVLAGGFVGALHIGIVGLAVVFLLLAVHRLIVLGVLLGRIGIIGVEFVDIGFGDQVEIVQDAAGAAGKFGLVLEVPGQIVERGADPALDAFAPEVDDGRARGGHGHAGQPFAHHQAQRL